MLFLRVTFLALLLAAGPVLSQSPGSDLVTIERDLRTALGEHPDWKPGLWRLGVLLYQQGHYEEARKRLEHLTTLDPASGEPWVLLGLCEAELRQFAAAAEHLERGRALGIAEELQLTDTARYQHAVALLMTGRPEHALWLLYSFADHDVHPDEVVLAMGLAAMRISAVPEDAPRSLSGEQLDLLRRAGEAEYQERKHNDAAVDRIYAQLFKDRPAAKGLHTAYASLLVGRRDVDKAAQEFAAELRLAPEDFHARLGLVWVGLQRGLHLETIPDAREAVRLRPSSALAHLYLGRLLLRADQLPEATAELERSRDLNPTSSRIRFVLAEAYRAAARMDDVARELADFRRLKKRDDSFLQEGTLPPSEFLSGAATSPE